MIEESIEFNSDELLLEGKIAYSDSLQTPKGYIFICPPHPFLGGDIQNNVISHLLSALTGQGYLVMTFNYQGIGKSQSNCDLETYQKEFWEDSTCPEYEEKIFKDSQIAINHFTTLFPKSHPLILIGYSFGCLPIMEIMLTKTNIDRACFISPPIAKWGLKDQYKHLNQNKLFVYSPNDFACPEEELKEIFKTIQEPKFLQKVAEADHFFIGKEKELTTLITSFLNQNNMETTHDI